MLELRPTKLAHRRRRRGGAGRGEALDARPPERPAIGAVRRREYDSRVVDVVSDVDDLGAHQAISGRRDGATQQLVRARARKLHTGQRRGDRAPGGTHLGDLCQLPPTAPDHRRGASGAQRPDPSEGGRGGGATRHPQW